MYFISQKQTLILFFQVFTYLSILRPLYMPADTALELQVGADDISTAQKWDQIAFVRRPALRGKQKVAVSTQAWDWLQVLFYGNQDFLFVSCLQLEQDKYKSLNRNLKINDLSERDSCSKCVTVSHGFVWVKFNYHLGQLMGLLHSVYVTDTLTRSSAITACQINIRINSFLLNQSIRLFHLSYVNVCNHQFPFPTKILS